MVRQVRIIPDGLQLPTIPANDGRQYAVLEIRCLQTGQRISSRAAGTAPALTAIRLRAVFYFPQHIQSAILQCTLCILSYIVCFAAPLLPQIARTPPPT